MYLVLFTRSIVESMEIGLEKNKPVVETRKKYYAYVDAKSMDEVKNHCTRKDTVNHIFECPQDTKFIKILSEKEFANQCKRNKIPFSRRAYNHYIDVMWQVTMIEMGKESEYIPLTLDKPQQS